MGAKETGGDVSGPSPCGKPPSEMTIRDFCDDAMRFLPKQPDSAVRAIDPEECRFYARKMAELGMEVTEPIFRALSFYLSGASLYLTGKNGTGKSAFWKILSKIRVRQGDENGGAEFSPFRFAFIHMPTIQAFGIAEVNEFLVEHMDKELVVDDICADNETVDYGKRIDMLSLIVSQRDSVQTRTHFTGNVELSRIEERFGCRIASRMSRVIPVAFNSEDMRVARRAKIPIVNSFERMYLAESFVMLDRPVGVYRKKFIERFYPKD